MKKFTLILLVMLITFSIAYAGTEDYRVQVNQRIENHTRPGSTRDYVPELLFNFEGDDYLANWETGDTRIVDPGDLESEYWQLINNVTIAYPNTANYTWFPGDLSYGNNGGYKSGRLLYLQSPSITLPASPAPLTFKFKQAFEDLGGGTIGGVVYDGWDGWNVRISTNGTNWTVIQPVSPVYNSVNLYGFGYNGDRPQPMPGWGGLMSVISNNPPVLDDNGWATATFDLTAYAGQSVYIRWIIGTDPAYDTVTAPPNGDPDRYGVVMTDININGTPYNFTSATDFQGFTVGYVQQSFPELWRIRSPFSFASSPTSVATCGEPDANGIWSYQLEMDNYLTTPWVTIPGGGNVIVDFKYTNFPASDTNVSNTNWDGIAFDVYHDLNGPYQWYSMSDPYVFNSQRQFFTSSQDHVDAEMDFFCNPQFSDYAWSSLMEQNLNLLGGRQVKFRVVFLSQMGELVPNRAIKIDDFTLFFEQLLNVPTDVTAEVTEENNVALRWVNPYSEGAVLQAIIVERKLTSEADWVVLDTIESATETTFIDRSPLLGAPSSYRLQARYNLGTTFIGSKVVKVLAPASNQRVFTVDNGTLSALATPTVLGFFANKFDAANIPEHSDWNTFIAKYALIYIKDVGTSASTIRIWKEGEDSNPGALAVNIPSGLAGAEVGWNIITIPESNSSLFNRETVFVGYNPSNSSAPKLGISQPGTGVSWTGTTGGVWTPYADGVYMIRLVGESGVSDTDVVLPKPATLTAKNYPNPFNPETTIEFNMPTRGRATVEVYNIKGQLVNTLLNNEVTAGDHRVIWSGQDSQGNGVTSGVYFYKVKTDGESIVNKMLLLK